MKLTEWAENSKLEGDERLRAMMEVVEDNCVPYEAGSNIMTDDKAPVELLGMRQIDSIIKDEVKYYKEIYKTQGFEGLF